MSSEIRVIAVVPVAGGAFAVGAVLGQIESATEAFRAALGEDATFDVTVVKLKRRKLSMQPAAQIEAQPELLVQDAAQVHPSLVEVAHTKAAWRLFDDADLDHPVVPDPQEAENAAASTTDYGNGTLGDGATFDVTQDSVAPADEPAAPSPKASKKKLEPWKQMVPQAEA